MEEEEETEKVVNLILQNVTYISLFCQGTFSIISRAEYSVAFYNFNMLIVSKYLNKVHM